MARSFWFVFLLLCGNLGLASGSSEIEVTLTNGKVKTVYDASFQSRQKSLQMGLEPDSTVSRIEPIMEYVPVIGNYVTNTRFNAPILLISDNIYFLPNLAKGSKLSILGNSGVVELAGTKVSGKLIPFKIDDTPSSTIRSFRVVSSSDGPEKSDGTAGTISISPGNTIIKVFGMSYNGYVDQRGSWYDFFGALFGNCSQGINIEVGSFSRHRKLNELSSLVVNGKTGEYCFSYPGAAPETGKVHKPVPIFPIVGYIASGAFVIIGNPSGQVKYQPKGGTVRQETRGKDTSGISLRVTGKDGITRVIADASTAHRVPFLAPDWSDNYRFASQFLAFQEKDAKTGITTDRYFPLGQVLRIAQTKDGFSVITTDGKTTKFDNMIVNYPRLYAEEYRYTGLFGLSAFNGQTQATAIEFGQIKEMVNISGVAAMKRHGSKYAAETNKLMLFGAKITLFNNRSYNTNGVFIADGYGKWSSCAFQRIGLPDYYFWTTGRWFWKKANYSTEKIPVNSIAKLVFDKNHQRCYHNCPVVTVYRKHGGGRQMTLPLSTASYGGDIRDGFWPETDFVVGILPDGLIAWQLDKVKSIEFK